MIILIPGHTGEDTRKAIEQVLAGAGFAFGANSSSTHLLDYEKVQELAARYPEGPIRLFAGQSEGFTLLTGTFDESEGRSKRMELFESAVIHGTNKTEIWVGGTMIPRRGDPRCLRLSEVALVLATVEEAAPCLQIMTLFARAGSM